MSFSSEGKIINNGLG